MGQSNPMFSWNSAMSSYSHRHGKVNVGFLLPGSMRIRRKPRTCTKITRIHTGLNKQFLKELDKTLCYSLHVKCSHRPINVNTICEHLLAWFWEIMEPLRGRVLQEEVGPWEGGLEGYIPAWVTAWTLSDCRGHSLSHLLLPWSEPWACLVAVPFLRLWTVFPRTVNPNKPCQVFAYSDKENEWYCVFIERI